MERECEHSYYQVSGLDRCTTVSTITRTTTLTGQSPALGCTTTPPDRSRMDTIGLLVRGSILRAHHGVSVQQPLSFSVFR